MSLQVELKHTIELLHEEQERIVKIEAIKKSLEVEVKVSSLLLFISTSIDQKFHPTESFSPSWRSWSQRRCRSQTCHLQVGIAHPRHGTRIGLGEEEPRRDHQDLEKEGAHRQGDRRPVRRGPEKRHLVARAAWQGQLQTRTIQTSIIRTGGAFVDTFFLIKVTNFWLTFRRASQLNRSPVPAASNGNWKSPKNVPKLPKATWTWSAPSTAPLSPRPPFPEVRPTWSRKPSFADRLSKETKRLSARPPIPLSDPF